MSHAACDKANKLRAGNSGRYAHTRCIHVVTAEKVRMCQNSFEGALTCICFHADFFFGPRAGNKLVNPQGKKLSQHSRGKVGVGREKLFFSARNPLCPEKIPRAKIYLCVLAGMKKKRRGKCFSVRVWMLLLGATTLGA